MNTITQALILTTILAGWGLVAKAQAAAGNEIVGTWRKVSATIVHEGKPIDMHAALALQRPCVERIRHVFKADRSYAIDFSASGCDQAYERTQQKLHASMCWKVDGDRIMMSTSNFALGHTYRYSINGKRMTWVGTEGQSTIVYER